MLIQVKKKGEVFKISTAYQCFSDFNVIVNLGDPTKKQFLI